MIQIGTVSLPDDLWWEDETEWTPVDQSSEYSVAGSLLVDIGVKLAGRPITLVGDEHTAWVNRATVLALMDLAALPGEQFPLTLHDRVFTVMFRHGDGKPVDAEALVRITPPEGSDYYILKALRLMIVS